LNNGHFIGVRDGRFFCYFLQARIIKVP